MRRYPLLSKKVEFSYNKNEILKGINLTVKHNQIIAIIGRSGEGKSTFLNLVAGVLTKKFKGKINILGYNRELSKEDLGYVPQELSFIPDLSIKDNIIFFGNLNGLKNLESIKRGKELMRILQLLVPIQRLPKELSGGQKVRLNILLSFLHNPKILILDEPFVGLDYKNRKLLWHFLEYQKNRKKTILLTTHMLTEAEKHSDQIILLNKGKIAAKGKMKDLFEKLKINYISEIKIKYLSKKNEETIKKYCFNHDITIMDSYNNYLMFSIKNDGQRNYLFKFFDKLNIEYEELEFRKPNLDELSLKVTS